jgi:hypothetical protein
MVWSFAGMVNGITPGVSHSAHILFEGAGAFASALMISPRSELSS